jgi:hypothetical protein
MNMLFGQKLDLSAVAPAGEYTPLPEGVYAVICTEFDVETKNNQKGDLVTGAKVKFQVIEGQYAGRKISDYFIIMHSGSAMAQDIGQRRLRSWCDALGIAPTLESAEPLLHKPVKAKVKIDPTRTVGDKTYNAQNRIETFFAADSASAAAPVAAQVIRPAVATVPAARPAAAAPAAPATMPAATPKAMPWKR